MRPLLTILLFVKLGLVLGQPVNVFAFPQIVKEGQTMTSFVPDGWTIIDSATGDLNGDNEMDIAFVIKSKDSLITYRFIEFEGEMKVDRMEIEKYPRRILIIAFKDPQKGHLNLIEQSNSMIIGANTKIEIKNSLLKIEYCSSNLDSSYSSNSKYYFNYQNEQLFLTKVVKFTLDGLWTENCVLDFISKKMELTKGKVHVGDPSTIQKSLDNIQPKTMKEFKAPFTWHIAEGVRI